MTLRLRWALAAVPVLPAVLAAQTVLGRVVDSVTRRPVAGVTVRLVLAVDRARDTVVAATETTAEGAFLFTAPRPGTYRVRFGEAQVGPPLTLANADAEDQHEYMIGAVSPADTVRRYHVLHGAELDSAVRAGTPLLACQVETPAAAVPGTVALLFPPEMRGRQNTGRLLATFVVDTLGHVDALTLQVSRAPGTGEAFATSVARGLAKARYSAAISGGRKVRQRMYLPVTFRLYTEAVPPLLQGDPCGLSSDYGAVRVTSGIVGVGPGRFPR